MFASVHDAVERLREFSRALDPACVDARTAQSLVVLLAEASRLCDGATTRLAARVAETEVWAEHGARSPAEWVAKTTGAPMGEAIGMLETAAHLHDLPATESAVREGLLSPAQAHAIVRGACADPTAEAELLRAAHANRDLSTWIDHEGAGRLGWRVTPDSLARIKAALAPHIRRELTAARQDGRDETYGNCASDALLACVTAGVADGRDRSAEGSTVLVKARVDYAALVRGHAEPGELCEIEGVGPVPVSVIERMADEHPIVHAVLTKGRDVTRIAHLGRTGSTYLKEALAWRDTHCVVAGCTCSDYLEDHHIVEVCNGGISSLATEVRLCGHHHDRITHQGYRLVGSHEDGWDLDAPVPALVDTG